MATGTGVLAGLFTLLIAAMVITSQSGTSEASPVEAEGPTTPLGLEPGDCFDIDTLTEAVSTTTCDQLHHAELIETLSYQPSDGSGNASALYPGNQALRLWSSQACDETFTAHLDQDILGTSLAGHAYVPAATDWADGVRSINCYVRPLDGSPLTAKVTASATNLDRGIEVLVSRLLPGDCFIPAPGNDAYTLNSRSTVELVPCDEDHNGIFFGRDVLNFPEGAPFPQDSVLTAATTTACAEQFQAHFATPVDGFNFRFWRPSTASWERSDRTILCAVLDDDLLTVRFDPSKYRALHALDSADCFNLGPEEGQKTLRIDDQVLTVSCNQPHLGQLIGTGQLGDDDEAPYPGEEAAKAVASAACEAEFTEFIGLSPDQSDLGSFPYWWPGESDWEDGDRLYACAFVDEQTSVGSLEGVGR